MNDDFNIDDLLSDSPSASADPELDDLLAELNRYGISSNDEDQPVGPLSGSFSQPSPSLVFPQSPAQPASDLNQFRAPSRNASVPAARPAPSVPVADPPRGFVGAVIRHKVSINLVLFLIAVVLILGIAYMILFQGSADPYNNRILEHVSIGSIDVGGMTKSEALNTVEQAIGTQYRTPMVVIINGARTEISPEVSGIKPDLNAAVNAAYALGREDTAAKRQRSYMQSQEGGLTVNLTDYLNPNADAIRSILISAVPASNSVYTESSYSIEGRMPALDSDSFDDTAPCQVLQLYMGTPGSEPDIDGIYDLVMAAYDRCEFTVEIPDNMLYEAPQAFDLNAIYDEIYVAPVEAYTDPVNSLTYDGSCGYEFDRAEAQRLVNAAAYGQTVSITLKYIVPEKLSSKDYYPFTLSTFTTEIQGEDAAYLTNMHLAARALDGKILQPGEAFSFEVAVPHRTAVNGFVTAPRHLGTCADTMPDGGCDQIATTLFGAALCADLTILEFHTADHVCAFTAVRGTEVTCSDLKFSNRHSFPIQIQAKVTGTKVVIRFLVEEESGWYMELSSKESTATAPGTAYVSNTGRPANEEIFAGLSGGSFNLSADKYDSATKALISTGTPRWITVPAASRLLAS